MRVTDTPRSLLRLTTDFPYFEVVGFKNTMQETSAGVSFLWYNLIDQD